MNEMDDSQIQSNLRIAQKLEVENNGQFLTLCRMHLSFEIDLELENNEPGSDQKTKSKLWSKLQWKSGKAFPTSSEVTPNLSESIINQIQKLVIFLERKDNITQEGIFRKTGSLTRQQTLLKKLTEDEDLSIEDCSYTAHDCASVLKTVLAELDEPVITLNYFFAFQQVADIYNTKPDCKIHESRLLNSLQLLMLLIPKENRALLKLVVKILNKTIEHEQENKMTAESLSTLFTPHLVCPRKLSSEALYKVAKTMYSVVSFIIKTGESVFYIPEKLATDIRAYFAEKNRRKTMSPEQILNESVTSEKTAHTVFTFIDREKTAKAHDTETTDTALANLYAYIVSLPESSRKKKLIHKFNKENGKGTPLQFLNGQREKHSTGLLAKTLGSSIKKHIFQKNFLSKTPKRGSSSNQTPKKTAKVLFSDTPRLTSTEKSNLSMNKSPESVEILSADSVHKSILHEFHLTQKISTRSISDSHLNKSYDPLFDQTPPSKERSASVGDIHNLVESKDEVLKSTSTTELNREILVSAERNDISEEEDEIDKPKCMFSPSKSTNTEFDEIHNTPALYSISKRLSMSPITKSTKRMPKSMQEQIMTPRSRKPITAIESLSSENKSNVFESLLEESEVDNASVQDDCTNYNGVPSTVVTCDTQESVSNTFKEYLLNRSVVITELSDEIPDDDASFTSHPDDFIDDIKDLSESQMSDTMLFCLDGNDPTNDEVIVSRKRTMDTINDEHLLKEPSSKRFVGETSL